MSRRSNEIASSFRSWTCAETFWRIRNQPTGEVFQSGNVNGTRETGSCATRQTVPVDPSIRQMWQLRSLLSSINIWHMNHGPSPTHPMNDAPPVPPLPLSTCVPPSPFLSLPLPLSLPLHFFMMFQWAISYVRFDTGRHIRATMLGRVRPWLTLIWLGCRTTLVARSPYPDWTGDIYRLPTGGASRGQKWLPQIGHLDPYTLALAISRSDSSACWRIGTIGSSKILTMLWRAREIHFSHSGQWCPHHWSALDLRPVFCRVRATYSDMCSRYLGKTCFFSLQTERVESLVIRENDIAEFAMTSTLPKEI